MAQEFLTKVKMSIIVSSHYYNLSLEATESKLAAIILKSSFAYLKFSFSLLIDDGCYHLIFGS